MTIEKMREEFEAWAAVKFAVGADLLAASRTDEDMDNGFPYRVVNQHGEESDLVNTLVGTAWAGWQASRAALVVELPNRFAEKYQDYFDDVEGGCFNEGRYINDLRIAIEAAGVKVAP